jgi:hypothetical protein
VYILEDPKSDFSFGFTHFLCIYSAWYYWHPETIYLHTNAIEVSIEDAREGKSGKWNRLIFNMPGLRINHVEPPTVAGNGVAISKLEHKSDFIRVAAVYDFGGVYIDWDAHAIRDIKALRESGFNAIVGREHKGTITSGTFMAKKGNLLIKMWKEEMHRVFDGEWATHSNNAITRLGQRLARLPGEVLIMEQDAFVPGSWEEPDSILLYELHDDIASNLENVTEGSALPSYEEGLTDRWDRPQDFPPWDRDYSNTYILHAFSPKRHGGPVEDFEHMGPKYVLQRQSNFARLLYPVAKHMYDAGLIEIND